MTIYLTIFSLILSSSTAVAQSNHQVMIKVHSQFTFESKKWIVQASNFSMESIGTLDERNAFKPALQNSLIRRSEPGPDWGGEIQTVSNFSTYEFHLLDTRSEFSKEEKRKLNKDAYPPERWLFPYERVSSLVDELLLGRSKMDSEERLRLKQFLSGEEFSLFLQKASIPSYAEQTLIEKRSRRFGWKRQFVSNLSD